MIYNIILSIHNVLRWFVLIAAVFVLYRSYSGWLGKKTWTSLDDRAGLIFTSILDLQILVGLVLYLFLSPETRPIFTNFSTAFEKQVTAFFGIEHALLMFVGMGLAHAGRSLSKKATAIPMKYQRMAVFFTISLVIILLAIPWPFSQISRPWL